MRPLVPVLVALPAVALAAPRWLEKTAQLGPQPCSSPAADAGCYTSYALLADVTGDGKLDVVFPNAKGYYVQDQPAEPLIILQNDGSASFTDISATSVGGFTGWLRQVALGDVDGDGDLDIAAPDAWGGNAALFVNDGAGHFTNEAATRWNVTTRAGSVRFADVDDDGDLDLLVGDWGTSPTPSAPSPSALHLWLNDGSGHFTAADDRLPPNPFASGGRTPIDLDILDANGDFRPDVLIDSRNGDLHLYLNDGTGHFTEAPFPSKPGPYSYDPGVCDVDGDGDLDVWVDNGEAVADPQLLINDGAGHFTDESAARVAGAAGQDDNGVICADIDGDGDFDAVIMSLGDGASASNNERVLVNDGTGHFTFLAESFPLVGDSTLGMDIGDLDGDHRMDAVTGQGESGSFVNRLYLATNGVAADTRAPVFRAVEQTPAATVATSATPVVHFAIADEVVTDVGPRLSDVHVEWTGAAPQNVPASFVGGDLFRATLPARGTAGSATWRACATDRAGNQACGALVSYAASGNGGGGPGGGKKGCSCDVTGGAGAARGIVALGLALAALAFRARSVRR